MRTGLANITLGRIQYEDATRHTDESSSQTWVGRISFPCLFPNLFLVRQTSLQCFINCH